MLTASSILILEVPLAHGSLLRPAHFWHHVTDSWRVFSTLYLLVRGWGLPKKDLIFCGRVAGGSLHADDESILPQNSKGSLDTDEGLLPAFGAPRKHPIFGTRPRLMRPWFLEPDMGQADGLKPFAGCLFDFLYQEKPLVPSQPDLAWGEDGFHFIGEFHFAVSFYVCSLLVSQTTQLTRESMHPQD